MTIAGCTWWVNPNGSRWWRFKYKYGGKERGISLGVYPDVPLQYAREQLQDARQLLARGIDPSVQRRTVKIAKADSFKVIAEEWLEMQAERLTPITMTKARWILGSFIYPRLGSRPIAAIAAPKVLAVLRPIESRGMNETAHRALQRCGQIFRYAIATGRATRDITSDLRGALAPVVVENRAAITEPEKIGALLRAIDDYIGHPTTLMALKLSSRSLELCHSAPAIAIDRSSDRDDRPNVGSHAILLRSFAPFDLTSLTDASRLPSLSECAGIQPWHDTALAVC